MTETVDVFLPYAQQRQDEALFSRWDPANVPSSPESYFGGWLPNVLPWNWGIFDDEPISGRTRFNTQTGQYESGPIAPIADRSTGLGSRVDRFGMPYSTYPLGAISEGVMQGRAYRDPTGPQQAAQAAVREIMSGMDWAPQSDADLATADAYADFLAEQSFQSGDATAQKAQREQGQAAAPSMYGPNSQAPVPAMTQNEVMDLIAGMTEGFEYDIDRTGWSNIGQQQQELPTFGPDLSGIARIEEMYAAGYLSLEEAEELRRQEIQNVYADLYSQYDAGADEMALRQLATEEFLGGTRQTIADELASYGYDSSGFDAEMQMIDEIRGMDQTASANLLNRLGEIARTGEAGALSGLSESAMMARTGMEMQEMAAIEAETQRARAAAAAQKAAYLEEMQNAQNFEMLGQVFGMPAQVAQSLDAVGLLDNYIDMAREDAAFAQAQAQDAIAAANESAAQMENSQLGAELVFGDPSLWPVFDLMSNNPWVREDFGFGAGPEPTPNWIDLITKQPELIALYPDALAEVEDSFGNISFDDAMMAQILMSMLMNSPEGDAFLVGE